MRRVRGVTVKFWGGFLCLLVVAAAGIVHSDWIGEKLSGRRATGEPQLVSVEPLPAMDGEMCEWIPASASGSLRAELLAASAQAEAAQTSSTDVDREPLRVIRDTYPTYSAVGVDLKTNEVYLQDENLFGLMVFDRQTNTPPAAAFSEPKRRLRGSETRLEFNCSLYVDQLSGDVYSVNNDMVDTMVVFPRGATGNAVPMRQLHTPHRAFGIAVDEDAKELYMTVQHPPQVVVYEKYADGEDKPLRILRGDRTQLKDAHGIALDPKNNLMFISNHGTSASEKGSGGSFEPPSITVYPLKASGNTPPLRVIQGPKTEMNWPALLYYDEAHKDLYVANDVDNSVLVFKADDQGDVAPTRVIKGPKTGLMNPTGIFLDPRNDELWISNMGNHSAGVFRRTANGDVAPLRTIRSAPIGKTAQMIGNPGGVGYDPKREQILVPN